MGAWSHEPFGNDTACDWASELQESEDLSVVEAALDGVLDSDAYLDADTASEAIAAMEVLAKLLGHGTQSDAYTEEVDEWVAHHAQRPSAALLTKARKAIDRITAEDSELAELWKESESAEEWNELLATLRSVLS